MAKAVKKWIPIIEELGVTNEEKIGKMCEYAEFLSKVVYEKDLSLVNINGETYLSTNLKLLSKLDNFNLTSNPTDVITITFTFEKHDHLESEEGLLELETTIIDYLLEQLQHRTILIYTLIDRITTKEDKVFVSLKINI